METTEVSFSAKDVMALRQKTGLGMMDCKKALSENGGNMEAAEQWLRERLKDKMNTRTERATGEGRVGVRINGDQAVIVEVRTETDFTAKTDGFAEMMNDVVTEALALPAGDVEPTASMTKRIDDLRITTGENVNFARGVKLQGGHFGQYVHHDGKRACLLQLDAAADDETLKGVCQHIVFHDPQGITEADVPAARIEAIRTEALAEARDSGKNDEIAGKIADGKVRKYLQEHTLLNQKYVLDESKTVMEMLPSGVSVTRFVRYTLGG